MKTEFEQIKERFERVEKAIEHLSKELFAVKIQIDILTKEFDLKKNKQK